MNRCWYLLFADILYWTFCWLLMLLVIFLKWRLLNRQFGLLYYRLRHLRVLVLYVLYLVLASHGSAIKLSRIFMFAACQSFVLIRLICDWPVINLF
jgi:hypothetical protein